jgi:hypothetical protein
MPKTHLFVKRACAMLTLCLALGLTACGGGGGGSSSANAGTNASGVNTANYTLPTAVSAVPPQ